MKAEQGAGEHQGGKRCRNQFQAIEQGGGEGALFAVKGPRGEAVFLDIVMQFLKRIRIYSFHYCRHAPFYK